MTESAWCFWKCEELRMQTLVQNFGKILSRLLYTYLHPLLGADEDSGV